MPGETPKDVKWLDPLEAMALACRDTIIDSSLGYRDSQCDRTYRGKPPPRMGDIYVAVWLPGDTRNDLVNDPRMAWGEVLTVNVTVTKRLTTAYDRFVDHQRELTFRVRQIAQLIHADNIDFRVTNRAKALLGEEATQGWIESISWLRSEAWQEQGAEWFWANLDSEAGIRETGISQTAVFGNNLRIEYLPGQVS